MDAFDADVLIYAAEPGHPLGTPVLGLLRQARHDRSLLDRGPMGSVLLIPEVLTKPRKLAHRSEEVALQALLAHLDLIAVDHQIASAAVVLGATYGLRAADAIHLATAVASGADRFLTNNQRDFPKSIGEIDIVYPEDLPNPG